ncbi:hypothetical protein ACA910_012181 [Epithemia clementina (nom. ined.)]
MKQKMRTGALDYEETEKLLSDQYKILKKIHNWDNQELALTGTTNMGRKGKVPNKKFKGESCPHCHRFGHSGVDCWTLEQNKSKRPEGWTSSNKGGTKKPANKKGSQFKPKNKKNSYKTFKGKCFVCGGAHKSTECPNMAGKGSSNDQAHHQGTQEHVLMAWDDFLIPQEKITNVKTSKYENASQGENTTTCSGYTNMSTENSEHTQFTTVEKCIHGREENSALYTQENESDEENKNIIFNKTKKNVIYMKNSTNDDVKGAWQRNEFGDEDDDVSAITSQVERYEMHNAQRTYLPAFKNVPTYMQEMAWAKHRQILFLKAIHAQENVRRCREQIQVYERVINSYRLMKMRNPDLPDVDQPRVLTPDDMKVLAMYDDWQRQSYLRSMVPYFDEITEPIEPKRVKATNQPTAPEKDHQNHSARGPEVAMMAFETTMEHNQPENEEEEQQSELLDSSDDDDDPYHEDNSHHQRDENNHPGQPRNDDNNNGDDGDDGDDDDGNDPEENNDHEDADDKDNLLLKVRCETWRTETHKNLVDQTETTKMERSRSEVESLYKTHAGESKEFPQRSGRGTSQYNNVGKYAIWRHTPTLPWWTWKQRQEARANDRERRRQERRALREQTTQTVETETQARAAPQT